MKCVMVMFDSLNRHMLPSYGCDWVQAPNFRATLVGYGLVPDGSAPAAFRRFLVEDAKGWARVVHDNRITLD